MWNPRLSGMAKRDKKSTIIFIPESQNTAFKYMEYNEYVKVYPFIPVYACTYVNKINIYIYIYTYLQNSLIYAYTHTHIYIYLFIYKYTNVHLSCVNA